MCGVWELMDGLAGAWQDQGCCPLPQDRYAQPPGTSSHPVGSGSPPKCQPSCSSSPTGNTSVDHWLSLPGRPREGWSGAARTPGTPRTPRACCLRVGAGCKDLHGWAHALPGPPGLVAVIRAAGPLPRDNRQRHGAPSCWFHSAGLLGWRSGLPELPPARVVCLHVTCSCCDMSPQGGALSPDPRVLGSFFGAGGRLLGVEGASLLISGTSGGFPLC